MHGYLTYPVFYTLIQHQNSMYGNLTHTIFHAWRSIQGQYSIHGNLTHSWKFDQPCIPWINLCIYWPWINSAYNDPGSMSIHRIWLGKIPMHRLLTLNLYAYIDSGSISVHRTLILDQYLHVLTLDMNLYVLEYKVGQISIYRLLTGSISMHKIWMGQISMHWTLILDRSLCIFWP